MQQEKYFEMWKRVIQHINQNVQQFLLSKSEKQKYELYLHPETTDLIKATLFLLIHSVVQSILFYFGGFPDPSDYK